MRRALFGFAVMATTLWSLSPPVWAVSMDEFKLNGFFDLEYEKADGPGHTTTPVGDENGSFDQYHFNLLMEFPVSDTVIVKGHIEYEHGPQLPSKGELKVEWSYVEVLVNNYLTLRGGLALTPFGIYNEIHDATPTYFSIRTPWEIFKSSSVGGHAMFPKFTTGLFARGMYTTSGDLSLSYVAYTGNGENATKNEAEKDENENKAVGGQVMISPLNGVTVGGSYYQGEKQTGATTKDDHLAWAASLDLMLLPVGIRAEYASSHLGTVTQIGWYGEASYAIKKLTPYVRYGGLDPDHTVANDNWTELVTGLHYRLQQNVVLKAEHRHFSGEPLNSKVDLDYNEWGAALAVAF
jgi:hypothetical protein